MSTRARVDLRARARTAARRLLDVLEELERPILVLLWLGGLALLAVTLRYYVEGNRFAGDAHAYWLTGQADYTPYVIPPDHKDAFLYSPAFAQLLSPFTWLPWPVFAGLWVTCEAAAFGWLLRPLGWRWVGPLLLFCAPELVIGNVLGFLGVLLVLGFSRPWLWTAFPLTKPPFAVAGLWLVARGEWRGAVTSAAVLLVVIGTSWLIDPGAWSAWLEFLTSVSGGAGGLVWRVGLGAVVVVIAARRDRRWLLAPALLVATPVFAGSPSLTLLAAVPRLLLLDRSSRDHTSGSSSRRRLRRPALDELDRV